MMETAEYLKKLDNQIAGMYVARTEIKKSKVVDMMNGERGDGTSLSATEAKDEGFIDELLDLSSKRSKSASNRHDFGSSLNRLQIKNIPKNLIDESCSCSRYEARRGKDEKKDSINRQILVEQQQRSRMRNRIRLQAKSN